MQKYSRKREAVLAALRSTDTHPTAEWVYRQVKPDYPDLSLATVYRNIRLFVEEGLAMSVGVVDGQERYDGNVKPHPHFVCDGCGRVLDVDAADDPTLDERLRRSSGLEVTRHELVFHGRCSECM